jgi:hypothetical protein
MTTFITQLNQIIAPLNKRQLLKSIGYRTTTKARERLNSLLESESVYSWLKTSEANYDMKYTSTEFIEKIATALSLDDTIVQTELQYAKQRNSDIRALQSNYIFVDTGFKRKHESVMALAVCEFQRYISLDTEKLVDMSFDDRLLHVRSLIKEHYSKNNAKAGIWGDIKHYIWFYGDNQRILLSSDGIIMSDDTPTTLSKATLRLGGKEIAPVLLGV